MRCVPFHGSCHCAAVPVRSSQEPVFSTQVGGREGTGTIARASNGGGALGDMVRGAEAAHGGTGLHVYHASYVNLVFGARSERGRVTLVAGSHSPRFPYFETLPWDNCLLQIG